MTMTEDSEQPIKPLPASELERDRAKAGRGPDKIRGDRDTHLPASEADELAHDNCKPLLEGNLANLPPG